jgi:ACS family glucarate transporter-like MFS transporter
MLPPDPIDRNAHPSAGGLSRAETPTAVRYGVLAFSVVMAVILYLDRMAISVAMPAIALDLDLPIEKVADSVAAFFWCYALLQIPAGWLGDRWGGRRALTLYVVAWSLAIGGMGLVGGLASLIAMRALLGVGQAGAYATTASFLRRWMPFSSRGFANSSVSLGGRAGGALAPALTSLCMAAAGLAGMTAGRWRPVFVAYGAIGLAWAWLFWRWFRDRPREHPQANAAEVALIAGPLGHEHETTATAPAISVSAVVHSRSIWFLALNNYVINVGWILVGTLLPTYLIKVHGQSEIQAGFATSLVAFSGMGGCLAGGFATDLLARRLGLVWGRRAPCLFGLGGAAVTYGICFFLDDPRAIVALLVVSSFLGDFGLGALWCTYQDIGGAYAGTVLGVGNMCGNIGAAMASSFVPRLAESFGWSASFALSSGAYLVGALAWFMVDPRVPIVARPPAAAD